MHALLTFNCSGRSQQHLAALINIFNADVITVMKLKHKNLCADVIFLKAQNKNFTYFFLSKKQFIMIRAVKLETLKKKKRTTTTATPP